MPRVWLAKWGNSLAVRIPRAVAGELRLKAGDSVMLTASKGHIELRRATTTLEELVAAITP